MHQSFTRVKSWNAPEFTYNVAFLFWTCMREFTQNYRGNAPEFAYNVYFFSVASLRSLWVKPLRTSIQVISRLAPFALSKFFYAY